MVTTALKMKRKFDIAYLIAKHNLAFTKMGPLCELEERHGVDLGQLARATKMTRHVLPL